MVIRRKMFIIIVSAFVGIMLIFALSGLFLMRGFSSAEDQEVRGNVLRATGVFNSALDNLAVKVHDWAAWDDTYEFIRDRNAEYVESNLTPESLQSLGINMMIFIDREGRLVKSRNIDMTTRAELPLPEKLSPYLQAGSPLIQYDDLDGVEKGVIALPEGLLMVTARPIETSKQQGPIRGTIIFGKFIDEPFVDGLAKTIDFPLRIQPYSVSLESEDFMQAKQVFEAGGATAVIPFDQDSVAGYAAIRGVDGQQALIVRAMMSRGTLALGRNTIIIYFVFIFITLVTISVGMWFLIDKFVLSRMSRLTALVASSSSDKQHQIVLPGSDEFSNLAGVINTLTSQLQDSLHELVEAKAKDDAILASVGDGLAVADEEGKLIYVNAIGEEILGAPANEDTNQTWQEAYGAFDATTLQPYPADQQPLYLATQGKVSIKVPIFIRNQKHPNGVFIEVTATPIFGDGKTLGGVAIFRDMSKERAIDQAKTEFVSLASHQLRTPLTSIRWYTEMILAGDAGATTPKQRKYLQEIYAGNQRMVELVNALLSVSRLELGTFAIQPELTDAVELTKNVIKEQKPQITAKKIRLTTSFSEDAPSLVTDPKLLRMVMQNLLSNAVKYTSERGEIAITIACDERKKNMVFTITDTGCGIPKSQQDKIFTKLFRADNARSIDAEGTGLGLYIVKSIIEQSGGKISFESEENKGTAFRITLPIGGHDTLTKL